MSPATGWTPSVRRGTPSAVPTMSSFSEEKEVNRTMDPNETLKRIRELVAEFNAEHDIDHPQRELVDAIVDLDEWLTGDGFLPDGWAR